MGKANKLANEIAAEIQENEQTVPHKKTKTKHSYILLSGTLAKKISGQIVDSTTGELVEKPDTFTVEV